MTDQELLRQFVQDRSQPAFAELVRRHVDWVHSAALRRLRDPHLAEDVTQATFLVLAQKAAALEKHTVLAAWLFTVMTRVSAQVRKREATRRHHETQAGQAIQRMLQTQSSEAVQQEWDQIVDVLDEVVGRLRSSDHKAVLLRFYQQKSFAEVAEVLGISEEAARKRVSRATDKLRAMLARKGIAIPATALAGVLLSHVTASAPAMVLEASVCAASVVSATGTSTAATEMARSVIQTMVWSHMKIVASLVGLLMFTVVPLVLLQTRPSQEQNASALATSPTTQQTEMTIEEATAELKVNYALTQDEVIRLIRPPFSRARAVWADKTFDDAGGSDGIRSIGFRWPPLPNDVDWSYMSFADMSLDHLLRTSLGFDWYQVEGLEQVKWTPVHGDFVIRESASEEQKIDALVKLINELTGQSFRSVKAIRSCLCAVEQNRPPGPPRVVHTDSSEPLSRSLHAPLFMEDGRKLMTLAVPESLPLVKVPNIKLDPADPNYETQLRAALDDVQKQTGAEWKIERREIEVFVLEGIP